MIIIHIIVVVIVVVIVVAEKLWTNVLCGVTAGVISSSMANPTDVLKVRVDLEEK